MYFVIYNSNIEVVYIYDRFSLLDVIVKSILNSNSILL